jgi:hypothetical protein
MSDDQAYSKWQNADLTEWSKEEQRRRSDRLKIEEDRRAVPCRICEVAFRRLRLTIQYCSRCGCGFCQGEHGNFAGRGGGMCVRCGPSPLRPEEI